LALQTTDGIIKAVAYLRIAESLEEQGELKASQDLLKELIALLEKLLNDIQTGITTRSDSIISLQDALNHFYDAANQQASQIFSPVRG